MFGRMFGRGNVNVNSMESRFKINPFYIVVGVIIGLIFQTIVLGMAKWGYDASDFGILLTLMLMGAGDLFFVAVAIYGSRLYLREEMIDIASLFASYNPEILNGGGTLIGHMGSMVKEGRNQATEYAQAMQELEQAKQTYLQLIANSQDMSGNVAPLPGSGNVNFVPFVDED